MDTTETNLRAAKVLIDAAASRLATENGYDDALVKLDQASAQVERDLRQYDYSDELEDEQPTEEFEIESELV